MLSLCSAPPHGLQAARTRRFDKKPWSNSRGHFSALPRRVSTRVHSHTHTHEPAPACTGPYNKALCKRTVPPPPAPDKYQQHKNQIRVRITSRRPTWSCSSPQLAWGLISAASCANSHTHTHTHRSLDHTGTFRPRTLVGCDFFFFNATIL